MPVVLGKASSILNVSETGPKSNLYVASLKLNLPFAGTHEAVDALPRE